MAARDRPPEPASSAFLQALESPGGGAPDCGVMIVVAHPDDETIGIGGQLSRLPQARIVHVTDGAPEDMKDAAALGFETRQAYAAARRRELEAAMGEAGLGPERLTSIGVVDQMAARRLPWLVQRIVSLLRERSPAIVVTHAYEGGHPDHDATAFAVHAARRMLEDEGGEAPELIEMPLYHSRRGRLVTQEFVLPPPGGPALPETVIRLSDAALAAKRRMLAAHATQRQVLAPFQSPVERFRIAPHYDFGRLPNGGEVNYDRFDWNVTGAEWPRLALEACRDLGLPTWL